MKSKLFLKCLLIMLVSLLPVFASAAVTITNGIFESTFDCGDWIRSSYPSQLSCDGFTSNNNICAGACADSIPCSETSNCKAEAIQSWANNPGGEAGTAAQVHYFYTGASGSGSTNNCSGGIGIDFPSNLTEFWFRYYVYYPADSRNGGWKMIYFETDAAMNPWMAQPYDEYYMGFYFPSGTGHPDTKSVNYPATWMSDNNVQGYGVWIPIEIHIKNDTDGTNGILQVWRGSDLIIDQTTFNTGVNYWTGIHLGSNGSGITGPADSVVGIRFDDIALATSNYTGFVDDGHGNQRIGLLDGVQQTPPPAEDPPQSQELILFEDWEANNVTNWDDDFIQGETNIDTTPVYDGNYAIKMESSNPGNYAHFFGDHPGVDGAIVTDVTVEEYYRPSDSFDWVTGLKLWIMNAFESWGAGYNTAAGQAKPHTWAPFYMTISADGNGAPYGQLTRADGLGGTGVIWQNYWQNVGNAKIFIDQWNKIKFRLKLNTLGVSDGIFQLWINDVLQCDYSNVNYRGTYSQYGWNHLMMSMHAEPAPSQNQWISRENIRILSGEGAVLLSPRSFQLVQ